MSKSFVRPTLTAAVPGDLSLALPKRQLDDIIEMIYQLDKIAPGTANYDTLLYGAEVKFYSARLALSDELETALPRFFAVGDGAGVTRTLAQAGASGVKVARVIRSVWENRFMDKSRPAMPGGSFHSLNSFSKRTASFSSMTASSQSQSIWAVPPVSTALPRAPAPSSASLSPFRFRLLRLQHTVQQQVIVP